MTVTDTTTTSKQQSKDNNSNMTTSGQQQNNSTTATKWKSDTRKQMKGSKHQSTVGTEGFKNIAVSEAAGGNSKDGGVKGSQGDVKNILKWQLES
jgi:hypothetical protein